MAEAGRDVIDLLSVGGSFIAISFTYKKEMILPLLGVYLSLKVGVKLPEQPKNAVEDAKLIIGLRSPISAGKGGGCLRGPSFTWLISLRSAFRLS